MAERQSLEEKNAAFARVVNDILDEFEAECRAVNHRLSDDEWNCMVTIRTHARVGWIRSALYYMDVLRIPTDEVRAAAALIYQNLWG